jgi:hypothetical protein
MKIFFVLGIGHADLDEKYYEPWKTDVTDQLRSCGSPADPQYEGLTYDPLFQQYDHGSATYAAALVDSALKNSGEFGTILVRGPFYVATITERQ